MEKNKKRIAQFFAGKCTKEQLLEMYQLFHAADADKQIADYLEKEWENFETGEYLLPQNFEQLYARTKKKSAIETLLAFRPLKMAASIALIGTLGFILYWFFPSHDYVENTLVYNEVATKRGETKHIRLSNGVEVMLNASSKIKYPKIFSEASSNIYINGAAYFKVVDQTTPLVIFADEVSAEVSKASFTISAYSDDDEITIAVEDGGTLKTTVPMFALTPSTPVKDAGKRQVDPDYGRSMHTLIVQTDEYFLYNKTARKLEHDKYDDHREYFAWVDGVLFFKEADLEHTLKQLSRAFDVDFDVKGCIDENLTFSGAYKKHSLNAILNQVGANINANYEWRSGRVILTRQCI